MTQHLTDTVFIQAKSSLPVALAAGLGCLIKRTHLESFHSECHHEAMLKTIHPEVRVTLQT